MGFGPWGFESLHPHSLGCLPTSSPILRCPHCDGGLTLADGVLVCAARHSFDVARQGYVSLFRGDVRHPGDTAEMVAARERFLAAGALRAAQPTAVRSGGGEATDGRRDATPCVVDLGAGTGYYLARVLDALPARTVGARARQLQARAAPCRPRARRASARSAATSGAACRSPTASPTLMLNVFAPRNGAEIRRVLAPGGTLIVVTPTPRHLGELVDAAGLLHVDERKQERLDDKLAPFLTLDRPAAARMAAAARRRGPRRGGGDGPELVPRARDARRRRST